MGNEVMNPFPPFWISWAAVGFAGETIAFVLRRRRGQTRTDTLSRNVQFLVLRGHWFRRLSLVGWFAFAIWFAKHIWG